MPCISGYAKVIIKAVTQPVLPPFTAVPQRSLYAWVFGSCSQFSLPCCSQQQSLYARVFGSSPRGQFSLPCCTAAVSLRQGVRWFPPRPVLPSVLFCSSLSTPGCSVVPPAASSLSCAVPGSSLSMPGCLVVPLAASSPSHAVLQQSLYARVFGGSLPWPVLPPMLSCSCSSPSCVVALS